MTKKVNIMIGRFQPFTNGHMKCIDYAYEKLGIPTIIAMIYTPESKVDEKHPFPSSLILPLYKEMFNNNPKIADIIMVKNANIVEIGETVYNNGYQIASWTCGTDRVDSYGRMAEKYKEKAHLTDDFQLLEIKRSDEDISATQARLALMDGNKKLFKSLTPLMSLKTRLKTGKDVYDILREQLKKVIIKKD